MNERAREITTHKWSRFSKRQSAVALVILIFIVAFGSVALFLLLQPPEVTFSLNAAIINQLDRELPNPTFVENVTTILTAYGFNVTHHNRSLNVNFFRELAKKNYGIIVLRVHSALREDTSSVDLFTSELYDSGLYVQEQENGFIVQGVLNYSGTETKYFAITHKFLENLEGRFPKSIIFAMGCWSLKPGLEEMAESFIKKGAKAYVGWTGLVEYLHTDNQTAKLLTKLLAENETIGNAINASKAEPDPSYGSVMAYRPTEVGNLRVSDLIEEAKAQVTYQLQTILIFKSDSVTNTIECRSKRF